MRYVLLIHGDEAAYAAGGEAAMREMYAAYGAFTRELEAAGVLGPADELEPSHRARLVRVRDGEALVTDGPFLEVREQLGGFYIIDVASMDEACRWAAKVPSAVHGTIEVRALMPSPTPG